MEGITNEEKSIIIINGSSSSCNNSCSSTCNSSCSKTKVLQATFKNDSEETISKITLEVKLKDTGEVIQMKYSEAVAPGAISNAFSGKAPSSGKLEDVEILKYKIALRNGTYMEYDVELRQYNWS